MYVHISFMEERVSVSTMFRSKTYCKPILLYACECFNMICSEVSQLSGVEVCLGLLESV